MAEEGHGLLLSLGSREAPEELEGCRDPVAPVFSALCGYAASAFWKPRHQFESAPSFRSPDGSSVPPCSPEGEASGSGGSVAVRQSPEPAWPPFSLLPLLSAGRPDWPRPSVRWPQPRLPKPALRLRSRLAAAFARAALGAAGRPLRFCFLVCVARPPLAPLPERRAET
uniref:Uncharacterized protein n=1 Tax=Camelus bactrianus TaxID=9837 RepID=A0A9W3FUH7_CAMBA|nr:putative uncharacterized protein CXorf42 [Camelus bactrianus]